jgi:hypothetical protein
VIGGRSSLFLVQTYVRGPLDVHSANSTQTNRETPDVHYFFKNTLWIIPRPMRHPLDRCVKVLDVR